MNSERPQDPIRAAGGPSLDREPALSLEPAIAPSGASPYRVLARKYRPANFDDLIGQQAMVRTLSNAFSLGRIHQAYMLTGVRGVGKTTTARILARAFNYELPDAPGRPGIHQPTIHMPQMGVHCPAIIESRHVDVIEMDAASHTGIDDVRDIIEGARYMPVSARCKVYIIDEVHMLSKQAFNGLLKTLEEPPEHVKFLFATTEIERVPVTVRSRCQRFDLRRIEADVLIGHLSSICERESIAIAADALALIARAAEGSVRDALSLLDQAIAHGGNSARIDAEGIRTMLGLADRSRIIDLFEAVMRGDISAALGLLKNQYDYGADPGHILADLADFVHLVTRLKVMPDAAKDVAITPEERDRGLNFAKTLTVPVLTRTWQILLKGLNDVRDSPRPLAAADMVLVRLAYAAELPSPDEVIRKLSSTANLPTANLPTASVPTAGLVASPGRQGEHMAHAMAYDTRPRPQEAMDPSSSALSAAAAPRLTRLEEVVALAIQHRDIQLKIALERDFRLIRFDHGQIEFSLAPGGSPQLASTLTRRLQEWTGSRWVVAISSQHGAPTLQEAAEANQRQKLSGLRADPLVQSVLSKFPGAEVVGFRSVAAAAPAPQATIPDVVGRELANADYRHEAADEDIVYADKLSEEDEF
jgi:DNA polymerase III subunit gamma/tau